MAALHRPAQQPVVSACTTRGTGLSVALISPAIKTSSSNSATQQLSNSLTAAGITDRGYAADVRERGALARALEAASNELGPIEVLNYSPVASGDSMRPVLETTVADLTAAADFSILGPATPVQQVLPQMGELGRGTILLVNGFSAATPNANVAGVTIELAG